jgi:hypothetical protein
MLLLTPGKQGPLRGGGWCEDMLTGVVVERTKTSIKVAFDAAPDTYEMDEEEWR